MSSNKSIQFNWPTKSKRITSHFGFRRDPMTGKSTLHKGIDIGVLVINSKKIFDTNENPVTAIADGTITMLKTEFKNGVEAGIYIEYSVDVGTEMYVRCMHLHQETLNLWTQKNFTVGTEIKSGDLIGYIGNTGKSTGAHLHIDLQVDEKLYTRIETANKGDISEKYTGTRSGYYFINPELVLENTIASISEVAKPEDTETPIKPKEDFFDKIINSIAPKTPVSETKIKENFIVAGSSHSNFKMDVSTNDHAGNYNPDKAVSLKPSNGNSKMASFHNRTPSEILNYYSDRVLNTVWDIRRYNDYSTFVLGRNNYFYKNGNRFKTTFKNFENETETVKESFQNIFEKDDENDTFDKVLGSYYDALKFNKIINPSEMNIAISQSLENQGVKSNDVSEMSDFLNREKSGLRKISENHIAASNFNLIYSSITYNDNVINTVTVGNSIGGENSTSTKSDSNWIFKLQRDSITVCKHQDKRYINEFMFEGFDEIISVDIKDRQMLHEYMSNTLIKELAYMYQGKILITFNSDIEIGDTVTLLDGANKRMGIFTIETYEHILDKRGLITVLNVKACVSIVEPCLDAINQNIISKIFDEFDINSQELGAGDYAAIDKNTYFKNMLALFNRYSIIYAKYSSIYNVDEFSVIDGNMYVPTSMPVKIYPFIDGGMMKFGDKTIFFTNNAATYNFTGYIDKYSRVISDRFNSLIKSTKNILFDLGVSITDIVLDVVTFGIHEFFKPMLGITQKNAQKLVFGKYKEAGSEEVELLFSKNPYSNTVEKCIYNVKGSFLDIGFMNIQLKTFNDLYSAAFPDNSKDVDFLSVGNNDVSYINAKIEETEEKKRKSDLFDNLSPELRNEIYNKKKNTLSSIAQEFTKTQKGIFCTVESYESFICKDIEKTTSDITKNFGDINKTVLLFKSTNDSNGKEYIEQGTVSYSNEFAKKFEIEIKSIPFTNERNRYYCEVTLKFKEKTNSPFKTVVIVFFHNLYKAGKIGEEQVMEIRKGNVTELLAKYDTKDYNGPDKAAFICADFNLTIQNATYTGTIGFEDYKINNNSNFVKLIDAATTLKTNGGYNKQYDNILISAYNKEYVKSNIFVPLYSKLQDKRITSDHVCVAASIKREGYYSES